MKNYNHRQTIDFGKYKHILAERDNLIKLTTLQKENDALHNTIKLYAEIVATKDQELGQQPDDIRKINSRHCCKKH